MKCNALQYQRESNVEAMRAAESDGDESPYPVTNVFDHSFTLRARIHRRGVGAFSGKAARRARIPLARKPLSLEKSRRSRFQRTWSTLFYCRKKRSKFAPNAE